MNEPTAAILRIAAGHCLITGDCRPRVNFAVSRVYWRSHFGRDWPGSYSPVGRARCLLGVLRNKDSSLRIRCEVFGTAAIVGSLLFVGLEMQQARELAWAAGHEARADSEMAIQILLLDSEKANQLAKQVAIKARINR